MTPEQLFDNLLRADPARPFVTYYDDATGERTELSLRSLANWVAKTHFLVLDELGLGAGDTALVALPEHWISYPAVLGCLTAGLRLTGEDPDGADVAFVSPQTAPAAVGIPDAYAVAPDHAALGLRDQQVPGAQDYVSAVRPQPDAWATVQLQADDAVECLPDLSRADAVRHAEQRAGELGLATGARLLRRVDDDASGGDGLVRLVLDDVLLPLAVSGSIVLVRHCPDDAVLARRAEQERVTAVL